MLHSYCVICMCGIVLMKQFLSVTFFLSDCVCGMVLMEQFLSVTFLLSDCVCAAWY